MGTLGHTQRYSIRLHFPNGKLSGASEQLFREFHHSEAGVTCFVPACEREREDEVREGAVQIGLVGVNQSEGRGSKDMSCLSHGNSELAEERERSRVLTS